MLGYLKRIFSSDENNENITKKKGRFYLQIAVYDHPAAKPRIIEVRERDIRSAIDAASRITYSQAREKGGAIPYTVIEEIIENLIHASFKDPVITISPNGDTIMVSDHGPGIPFKEKSVLPGYTSATGEMKRYIKGVGSGLPIAKETLETLGGEFHISDNLNNGTVITMKLSSRSVKSPSDNKELPKGDKLFNDDMSVLADGEREAGGEGPEKAERAERAKSESESAAIDEKDRWIEREEREEKASDPDEILFKDIDEFLNSRQKKVFLLMAELGELGPSTIQKELNISLSTAYRDLVTLEELELIGSLDGGKRKLTKKGERYLSYIFRT